MYVYQYYVPLIIFSKFRQEGQNFPTLNEKQKFTKYPEKTLIGQKHWKFTARYLTINVKWESSPGFTWTITKSFVQCVYYSKHKMLTQSRTILLTNMYIWESVNIFVQRSLGHHCSARFYLFIISCSHILILNMNR